MDGIYKLNLRTQMGDLDGFINIVTKDKNLSGYIELMGSKTEFSGGKVEGNNLYINGKAKARIYNNKIWYTCWSKGRYINNKSQNEYGVIGNSCKKGRIKIIKNCIDNKTKIC